MHDGPLPERTQQRELHRLRHEREPEVEVEDVGLGREPREGSPLRQLLPQKTASPREVDVRLRVQPVTVEDDEPRIDTASAERLDIRPRDPGGVHRAVRHAHHRRTLVVARAEDPLKAAAVAAADRLFSRLKPAPSGYQAASPTLRSGDPNRREERST